MSSYLSVNKVLTTFLYFTNVIFLNSTTIHCFSSGYIFTCPRSLKTGATNEMQLRRYGKLDAGEFKIAITYLNAIDQNETIATEQTFNIDEGEEI